MQENTPLTEEEKQARIKELQAEKIKLLDQYGVFGGDSFVTSLHKRINVQLEALGVDPNS